jgi:hypothetical protein
VLNIKDQATLPLPRVSVPIRTALSNSRGGAGWRLSGMPRTLLLLTFFFGRIPSNYLLGLETTGQRKRKEFTNQSRYTNKRNKFIKRNPTRCNNVSKFLLFHIYIKLNMFKATHRPSSGV